MTTRSTSLPASRMTSIKVPVQLREQMSVLARERGLTQASLIEQALAAFLRRERMQAAEIAMKAPLPEDYLAEARGWQALSRRAIRDGE